MNRRGRRRRITILNLAVGATAYMLALIIRYRLNMEAWMIQFYGSLFFITLLSVYFSCILTSKGMDQRDQPDGDPAQIAADVLKSAALQAVMLLMFLFVTKQAQRVSRLFVGIYLLLWVILVFTARLIYRRRCLKSEASIVPAGRVLIITHPGMEQRAAMLRDVTVDKTICLAPEEDPDELTAEQIKSAGCTEAFILLPESDQRTVMAVAEKTEQAGLPCDIALTPEGMHLASGNLRHKGRTEAFHLNPMNVKCPLLGVDFNVTNPEEAAAYIRCHTGTEKLSGSYITFCNVHTSVMAKEDQNYRDIQNGAALTLPDGMPIAAHQRKSGFEYAERTSGPDLMDALFAKTMDGKLSHFFYGSTEDTLKKLRERLEVKYPGIKIVGMYSPPFRDITPEEDAGIIKMIRDSGADLIWIGLGAPKQEKWMAVHKNRFEGVMLGVGAGFDFFAGTVKRAPAWVSRISMEWFYRLLQDPGRLIKRYLVTNVKFFFYKMREPK